MDIVVIPVLKLLYTVFDLYKTALIIAVILDLFISFQIVNTQNRLVYTLKAFLGQITEPFLGKIRKILPPLKGFDLSPLVLLLGVSLVQNIIQQVVSKVV